MIHDFCKNESEIFSRSGRTRGFALNYLAKLVFPCRRFFASCGNAVQQDRAKPLGDLPDRQ
jgi:hypothetical protein